MKLWFASSQAFQIQLTALYDLVNPTASAMWNLRWQVKGYLDERESASTQELHGRFVAGSGIGSANLRRHCVERTWEEQIGELVLLGTFSAIGLYEGWVDALEVGSAAQKRRLQFPSRGIDGRTEMGVNDTVSALQATRSTSLDLAYGPILRSSRRYIPARLDDMLACYRCFKEVRNAYAHAGRIPDTYAQTAYANAVPRAGGLGKDGRDIELPVVTAGQPVQLSLLHIQALCALLLNMVITLDAELAVTRAAEAVFLNRWRNVISFAEAPADPIRRRTRIRVMNNRVGYPTPSDTEALYGLLRNAMLVI